MKRSLVLMISFLFLGLGGFAGSALADHHAEAKHSGAHAQCTHPAGETCPHANKAKADDVDNAAQCTAHGDGEACSCSKKSRTQDAAREQGQAATL